MAAPPVPPPIYTNAPRTVRSQVYGVPAGVHREPGLLDFSHAEIENFRPYMSGLTPLSEYSNDQLPQPYRETLEGYETKRFRGMSI